MRADTDNAITATLDAIVTMAERMLTTALDARKNHNPATMSQRQKRLMNTLNEERQHDDSTRRNHRR